MDGAIAAKIEKGADRAAGAIFAAASGFATFAAFGTPTGSLPRLGLTAGVAALAYALCSTLLGRIAISGPRFEIPDFEIAAIRSAMLDELELTDADRLPEPAEEPLELDDVLHELGPDSRVVRLFDKAAMPTPAQLQARIDRHLGQARAPAGADDASQALVDALSELRRSLR
jgi:hypothetical protein